MALILNIETATETSSVCLAQNDKILSIKESRESMAHARETTLLIEACMKEAGLSIANLDAVAVSSGPGSYTALRVGSSIAKGICYAKDIPLISVSTLQSLALASAKQLNGEFYCPMIDARRKEVYTALYNNEITDAVPCSAEVLTPAFIAQLTKMGKGVFSGNGAFKLAEMIENPSFQYTKINCSSEHLVPISVRAFQYKKFQDIAYFEPTYLKPPNITVSKKRL